ncbi:DNA helicase RecQ [Ignatzschineria ureiclastica]|uniref:DNA helicase RecQ n=1 Tax=Ignatzschineria ureiclastica TaxID=472582 RepID=A0A2U2AG72_9GAMM|nr:DNA helicase RecQ [Ignatzschineria ureiclastica]PWD81652.1 DNA helicase RecQ [Ignatzschineria ureiclastica]GGZ89623.1 DNA helicase RecQ [Ignatzschineria ureiclastica]
MVALSHSPLLDATDALQNYFGYTEFREGQAPLVEGVLSGQDVLGIMPTGGGKSLCYQIPALLLPHITLVISPLISLMKDQVDALLEIGISATFINSTLDEATLRTRLIEIRQKQYKLIYIAPERLNSYLIRSLFSALPISFIAVDEAHCISKWGHDFRPAYGEIIDFVHQLPNRPVIGAYTATATSEVIHEIKTLLQLHNPIESIISFDRTNLTFEVLKVSDKRRYIINFIRRFYPNESGIIYCATRNNVEKLTEFLKNAGLKVLAYHGGMEHHEREKNQNAFIRDEVQIIVATNAFGMGIDKSNVRFVIHYNMPQNMEAYYQEAGRAGRDGAPAHCLLLYAPRDVSNQKYLIEHNDFITDPERKDILYHNLEALIDYCHTEECLRAEILHYFSETPQFDHCNNCSNCTNTAPKINITIEAQKILSCVYRAEQNCGITTIIQILRGSKNQHILSRNLDQLSTYGIMREYSESGLKEMIMTLIARGYLYQTTEARPLLKLNIGKAKLILTGQKQLFHRQDLLLHKTFSAPENHYHSPLYEEIRAFRLMLSKERDVPAYTIFSDKTLRELAEKQPTTQGQMLQIHGIGVKKFDLYGERLMELIRHHQAHQA